MGNKGVIELYENHEIAFHLVSYWFLTAYYDEVIQPREDTPLPPFAFFLLKLDEMSKFGYLGSLDPKFVPSEFCLHRDEIYYHPLEVEAIVDEDETVEEFVFLSCDNVMEAKRKLTRRVFGHMRASSRPHKLRLFMRVQDEEEGNEEDYSMQIMADRFQELTNQGFHLGDLLLPEKVLFHIQSSKTAKPDLDYDQFLMCDKIRDPDQKKERTVDILPGDKAMEKSRAHFVAYIVFLFDVILQESARSPSVRMLLTLCNSAGSAGRNADKLQKAVLGHCWMVLISNLYLLIDCALTDGAKRDLQYIGKCFAECLWDGGREYVSEYPDLLIALEGLDSLVKTRRSLRSWRPKGSDAKLEGEAEGDEGEEEGGEDEEKEEGDEEAPRRPPGGVVGGKPVYDGNTALEILNRVFESHNEEVPADGKKRKKSSVAETQASEEGKAEGEEGSQAEEGQEGSQMEEGSQNNEEGQEGSQNNEEGQEGSQNNEEGQEGSQNIEEGQEGSQKDEEGQEGSQMEEGDEANEGSKVKKSGASEDNKDDDGEDVDAEGQPGDASTAGESVVRSLDPDESLYEGGGKKKKRKKKKKKKESAVPEEPEGMDQDEAEEAGF